MSKLRDLSLLSEPGARRVALHVTPAAERAIKAGHPWLFADSIRKQNQEGRTGDLAVIFDARNRFLAIGLFDKHSPIRVRILHMGHTAQIDQKWFANKLLAAVNRRAAIDTSLTNGFRLVHGENDGLPGLVIDRYNDTLVVKIYSPAWMPYLAYVIEPAVDLYQSRRVVLRLSRIIQDRTWDIYRLKDGDILLGTDLEHVVMFQENGLSFEADVIHGQKTGFFLDQRENRSRVEKLASGKTVLNVFAYSGGFSLYAARGGAPQVTSLDLSKPALDAAARNFQHNVGLMAVRTAEHEIVRGDAFDLLEQFAKQRRRFDMVIVDPPAFAKAKSEILRAKEAYYRLTCLALGVLQKEGILVSASCSTRVTEEVFFNIIHQAANDLKRPLIETERTGHPIDHPIGFREGAYLKCLFGRAG